MNKDADQFRWIDLLGVAVASALALTIGGYCFGRGDHSTYLPMMWAIQDPNAFRGDLLIGATAHLHTFFWHIMALLTKWLPTQPTFAGVQALTVLGTCAATFGLAMALFKSRAAAYLSLALLMAPKGLLGLVEAGINSQPLLTQTNVAVCLLTFALWLFIQGRYPAAFFLVGITVNIQGMTASFVLVMFALYFVVRLKRLGWGLAVGCALSVLLPALPTLRQVVQTWSLGGTATSATVELWAEIMRGRMAHHVFPLSWPWELWARVAMLLACFAVAYRRQQRSETDVKVLAFACAILLMCVVGLLSSEVWPSLPLMQWQPFRSTRFLMVFGVLYLAADCVRSRGLIEGLGSCGAIAGAVAFPKGIALTAPLLLFYLGTRVRRGRILLLAAAAIWPFVSIAFAAPSGLALGLDATVAGGCWALFFLLAITVAAAARGLINGLVLRRAVTLILAASVAALAVGRLMRNRERWDRWTLNPLPNDSDWVDVQKWCRKHTPKNAKFLVPIHLEGFRCFSRRPIVADFKDAGPHMYSMDTFSRWTDIMLDFGLDGRFDPAFTYRSKPGFVLVFLARKYHAQYIVVERGQPMDGTPLYQNDGFEVYGVRPAPS